VNSNNNDSDEAVVPV